jgi:hypothetical protein
MTTTYRPAVKMREGMGNWNVLNQQKEDVAMKLKSQTLRLFMRWLKNERVRFINPIRVNKITKDTIEFNFHGITPAINGHFRCGQKLNTSIDIWVEWKKYHCDLLLNVKLAVNHSQNGWYCSPCLPERIEYYPTREDMLIKHTFETFLNLSNSVLTHFKWITLLIVDNQCSPKVLQNAQDEFHRNTNLSSNGCQFNLVRVSRQ